MSKTVESILQIIALGIFAVVVLFSMPFWLFSIFFVKGDEKVADPAQGIFIRVLNSESVWGGIALVSWVSFVAVLQRG